MNRIVAGGIHHVTLITRNVQANVDFYVGFLGLRLVKQTGGYEDALQLHLFYGDHLGAPGSLITFLVWEGGAAGRVGTGQVSEIALAVPPDSLGEWMTRALRAGVPFEGPSREFGEPVLRLKDPDGIIVKLAGADLAAARPWGDEAIAPRRLRGVTILTDTLEATASFIERFGYRQGPRIENTMRLISASDAVDIRDVSGYVPGIPGTGTVDHIAFRAPDVAAIHATQKALAGLNSSATNVHDRKYFTSLYVREPGGTLIELATDGPGFTVDEDAEQLGETLLVPPHDESRAQDIRVSLPQFSMPGEPRMALRDLPFMHRFHVPDDPDDNTIVLLHGSGGNEADLMPLARRIAPRATLLGVRGRSHEEGNARWFRRLVANRFDQPDIRAEAAAFEAFVGGAIAAYRLDPARLTFIGHSNGANFVAATMALYPHLISRAILLRAITVLDELPPVRLEEAHVLMLAGSRDPFGKQAPALADWFRKSGAALEWCSVDAGHSIVAEDETLARRWFNDELSSRRQ